MQHFLFILDNDGTGMSCLDGHSLQVITGAVSLCRRLVFVHLTDRCRHDRYHVDVVNVWHPCRRVRQTDGVPTFQQLDVEGPGAHLVPTAGVDTDGLHLLAVDTDGDIAALATDEADGELIVTALLTIDIAPLQVVLFATAQPSSLITA